MSDLSDYRDAIDELVPGTHPVTADEKTAMQNKAVAKAMDTHTKHRPREIVEDVVGDGGFDYALSGLASWEDGFSVIHLVEYPVDDDDETPDLLADDQWMVYETPSGKFLRFLEDSPTADEDMRLTYTARHTCTVSACTVVDADEEAVQTLAAAFFARMLTVVYANDQDSTIGADAVDHGGRHRKFQQIARDYRKEYNEHMGIVEGKPKPASVTHDQDAKGSWAGDRLTHRGRYR